MSAQFRTILVPHDFSVHANRALEFAAGIAGAKGRLIVLHVTPHMYNELARASFVREGRRRLERTVARRVGSRGWPAVEYRVEAGDPRRQITKAARGTDAIVLCTAGRTGLAHLLIGSVAEKVVRHAPVPVLTFRPEAGGSKTLFHAILVPHDFSRHATRALRKAAALAGPDGHLVVLHVVPALPESANRMPARIFATERRRLTQLVRRVLAEKNGPSVECRVEAGDPYRRITAAARRADSIVMGTLGRTGLPHLLIGSVAEKVVRHAPVPVLTVRPPAVTARQVAASRRSRMKRAS
jgi:nucleotide-binding universal stress UspA family protein